jgi:hypothetical protein
MKPTRTLRRRLERLATASALLALVGCDRIAIALNPPLLPSATAAAPQVELTAGRTQAVAVRVCPAQHYTTDLGYIPSQHTVHVSVGPLPRGVLARWDRDVFRPEDFGLPMICQETQLHLTTAAEADLSSGPSIEVRASSPSNDNQIYATSLRLTAAAVPPPPQACTASDIRSWQDHAAGRLPVTPDTALDDAQLARAGTRLLAAWTERTPNTLAVRALEWDGTGWRWAGPTPINATSEAEIEGLTLLGAAAPAVATPEAWLVYTVSSFQSVGIGNPMRLMARRLAAGQRFDIAIEPMVVGSPQLLRAGRSRDGLYVAGVQRDGARLQLWHARPDSPSPAWTEIALPDRLDTAIVRSVALALDADGTQLMALNRIDPDPIAGRWVERVQVWRLAVGGDPTRLEPAAPDQELQRNAVLPYGSGDLALLAGPAGAAAATPQALVAAWTAGDASPGHRVLALDGSTRTWGPLGNLSAHALVSQQANFSFHRQLFAGCGGAPTLAWAEFGNYPYYNAWAVRAAPDAVNGWITLGGATAQGDPARYSGPRISMLWDGIDGEPLALVTRTELATGTVELALRTLRPGGP